jgi:2-dehydropantoate 2-reductase
MTTTSLPPSLLLVGTGALASLFGARLAAAGVHVTMLGSWPDGLAALREHGVRLVEADGSERAFPVRVAADPAECRGISLALVLVKAWQTARAAEQLAACLPANGLALTLQNGWGNRETLEQALGPDRVALGITTLGATLLAPGVARAGGQGPVTLGSHPRLQPLADLLSAAGFDVRMAEDVAGLAWGKLVINAAINPLTALLRVPNGELLARPEARELLGLAAAEAAAVGRAQGLHLPFDDAVAAAEDVARRTAANHSSMFQDVQRGRPTEIDAICGAVVEAGDRLGVPTPVNRTLWLLVRAAGER